MGTDVAENGILALLQDLALRMRDARVVWRYRPCTRNCYGGAPSMFEKELPMKSLDQVVPDSSHPTANLTTEAEWEIWKDNMDMRKGQKMSSKRLALFIHCA